MNFCKVVWSVDIFQWFFDRVTFIFEGNLVVGVKKFKYVYVFLFGNFDFR